MKYGKSLSVALLEALDALFRIAPVKAGGKECRHSETRKGEIHDTYPRSVPASTTTGKDQRRSGERERT